MIRFKNVRTSSNSSVSKGSYKKVDSEPKESEVGAEVASMSELAVIGNLALAGRISTISVGIESFKILRRMYS